MARKDRGFAYRRYTCVVRPELLSLCFGLQDPKFGFTLCPTALRRVYALIGKGCLGLIPALAEGIRKQGRQVDEAKRKVLEKCDVQHGIYLVRTLGDCAGRLRDYCRRLRRRRSRSWNHYSGCLGNIFIAGKQSRPQPLATCCGLAGRRWRSRSDWSGGGGGGYNRRGRGRGRGRGCGLSRKSRKARTCLGRCGGCRCVRLRLQHPHHNVIQ
jgi:hypothetical protein